MEELLDEVMAFVEGDAKWWDDVAQHCEDLANGLVGQEQSRWQLFAAVYRERAQTHRELAERIRQRSGA